MQFPHNDYFFHYTTRDAAFEHILPSKTLRFSPYDRMRDPLENKAWRFGGAYWMDPVTVEEGHPDHPESAFFQFERSANTIKASAKLLSLTLDAPMDDVPSEWFSRGWSRARMWEQYAEAHAGACLLFKREELTETIVDALKGRGLAAPYHRPVEYTPEGPGGGQTLELGTMAGKVTPQLVAQYIEQHHDELFFLKTDDWRTEYEYRFVVTAPDDDFVYVDYGDALEAVIVGERFPEWQRPGVFETCREADATAFRIDWSMGRPLLAKIRSTA